MGRLSVGEETGIIYMLIKNEENGVETGLGREMGE